MRTLFAHDNFIGDKFTMLQYANTDNQQVGLGIRKSAVECVASDCHAALAGLIM